MKSDVKALTTSSAKEYASCDCAFYKMNVPLANHMRRIWEHQIRRLRNILTVCLVTTDPS